ncbi:hypothetical protein [Streptosporangium sp. NPDC000396]|uniref:hypothetical protein n=1 Tax=Streptosporangium sp. NPDC000396 TaxID=3366185 RepID=UPI003695A2EC
MPLPQAGPDLTSAVLATFGITALISRRAGTVMLDRLPPGTVVAPGLGATCFATAAVAVIFLSLRSQERNVVQDSRRRWRLPAVLLRLTLANTAFAAGYLAVVMFMPLVLLQRGAQARLPGLTLTGAATLAPLALWATRRMLTPRPHHIVLVAGTVLLAVLTLTMASVDNLPLTVSAYLAWIAVNGVLLGRWQALVADRAPETKRPRWFAFHRSSWEVAQPSVPGLATLVGSAAGTIGPVAFLIAGVAFLTVPFILKARVISC